MPLSPVLIRSRSPIKGNLVDSFFPLYPMPGKSTNMNGPPAHILDSVIAGRISALAWSAWLYSFRKQNVTCPYIAFLGLLIYMFIRFIFFLPIYFLYISNTTSYLFNHLKRHHYTVIYFKTESIWSKYIFADKKFTGRILACHIPYLEVS